MLAVWSISHKKHHISIKEVSCCDQLNILCKMSIFKQVEFARTTEVNGHKILSGIQAKLKHNEFGIKIA